MPAPTATMRATVERRMGRMSELPLVIAKQSAAAAPRASLGGLGRRSWDGSYFRGRWRPTEVPRAKKKPAHAPAFSIRRNGGTRQLRWLLMSLVISNIDTWPFLKISRSLASALIMVRLFASWRLFFLMYSQTFFVTSVRGTGRSPMIAASELLGVIAFMNAAFGVRFFAGAFAFFAFFAGAAFLAAFLT